MRGRAARACRAVGRIEQAIDRFGREYLGHSLPEFLATQQLGQIVFENAFQLQVSKKDLERNDVPRDAAGSQTLVVQPGHEVGEISHGKPRNFAPLEPDREFDQVAAVGGHGVLGQLAFAPRIVNERGHVSAARGGQQRGA